ncbi:MAG: hypothetical protein ACRDS1_17025 [Pseudonocardiaceae bacterium]
MRITEASSSISYDGLGTLQRLTARAARFRARPPAPPQPGNGLRVRALMHVVLAVAVVVTLEAIRRRTKAGRQV